MESKFLKPVLIAILILFSFLIISCQETPKIDQVYSNAQQMVEKGKIRKAYKYLEKNINEESRDDKYYFFHGFYLRLENPYSNFIKYKKDFLKSYNIKPDSYFTVLNLGVTYLIEEDFDQAIFFLKKVGEGYTKDSGLPSPFSDLVMAYIKTDQYEKASGIMAIALDIEPDYCWNVMNLGIVYAEKGNLSAFYEEYIRAVNLNPKEIKLHHAYGSRLIKLRYDKEAKDFYKNLLEKNNKLWFCYADLGYLLLLDGDFVKAEILLQKARRLSPRNSTILMYLSFYYYLQENNSKAFLYYEKSLSAKIHEGSIAEVNNIKDYETALKDNYLFVRIKMKNIESTNLP